MNHIDIIAIDFQELSSFVLENTSDRGMLYYLFAELIGKYIGQPFCYFKTPFDQYDQSLIADIIEILNESKLIKMTYHKYGRPVMVFKL